MARLLRILPLLAVLITACGMPAAPPPTGTVTPLPATSTPPPPPPSPTPIPLAPSQSGPGEIRVGTLEEFRSLDPAAAYDAFGWNVLRAIYAGLLRMENGEPVPMLAESYTASDDLTTYTFTIREDAAFSDGTPITAQTFADSYARAMALGKTPGLRLMEKLASAEAPDPHTLILTLNAPDATFPQLVTTSLYFPVNPADFPPDKVVSRPDSPAASGPYKIAARSRDEITLEANPQYAGPAPLTPQITIRFYATSNQLRAALVAGEVDVAWRGLFAEDVQNLRGINGLTITESAGQGVRVMVINSEREQTDVPAAREAIARLIDRDRLARAKDGTVKTLYTLIPPEFGACGEGAPAYDEEEAIAILEEGGFSRFGNRLEVMLLASSWLYGALEADAIREAGRTMQMSNWVSVNAQNYDEEAFFERLSSAIYNVVMLAWQPIIPEPGAYLRPLLHSEENDQLDIPYANAEIDRLLDKAAATADPDERAALYDEVCRLAEADRVVIPLWQQIFTVAAREEIEGAAPLFDGSLDFAALARR